MASRLSLAARLYSIFGLFALLTAAIAVLSDYNTRRGTELTHSIETANLAALNVERVNSLVYAVVMESRGVYMSTDPAVVKKFGDGLLKFNDHILDVVQKWQGIVQAGDRLVKGAVGNHRRDHRAHADFLIRRGDSRQAVAARQRKFDKEVVAGGAALQHHLNGADLRGQMDVVGVAVAGQPRRGGQQ